MSENILRRALANNAVAARAVQEARELTTKSFSESKVVIRNLDRQAERVQATPCAGMAPEVK